MGVEALRTSVNVSFMCAPSPKDSGIGPRRELLLFNLPDYSRKLPGIFSLSLLLYTALLEHPCQRGFSNVCVAPNWPPPRKGQHGNPSSILKCIPVLKENLKF